MRMTRAGRSIESMRRRTSTGTTIGRGSKATGTATRRNATLDATGRQRDIRTAIVTGGAPGAPSPRETEVATAGERGGIHGRLEIQSHVDDGEGVRALRKMTLVTRRVTKGTAVIVIRAQARATARPASQLPDDLAPCRRKRTPSRSVTGRNPRSPKRNPTSAIQVPWLQHPTRSRKQTGRRSR